MQPCGCPTLPPFVVLGGAQPESGAALAPAVGAQRTSVWAVLMSTPCCSLALPTHHRSSTSLAVTENYLTPAKGHRLLEDPPHSLT